ncbi:hypothetical protein POJ06DRAFT_137701 [Lipomyces tetrasporus]|uniref:Transmembrane protein n=1 Tax=Lipomyces tetrasporus TaxID=54092 RepID=A0AAD7QRT6_9ASCO|nr:uncharacterized protein POJ06DRAFT_137701 [Lipomyces tetrasporus]KAJ8098612.1 hypothetical protein POJ06DRAFT_137701 [Lipomyces tetrasporus]
MAMLLPVAHSHLFYVFSNFMTTYERRLCMRKQSRRSTITAIESPGAWSTNPETTSSSSPPLEIISSFFRIADPDIHIFVLQKSDLVFLSHICSQIFVLVTSPLPSLSGQRRGSPGFVTQRFICVEVSGLGHPVSAPLLHLCHGLLICCVVCSVVLLGYGYRYISSQNIKRRVCTSLARQIGSLVFNTVKSVSLSCSRFPPATVTHSLRALAGSWCRRLQLPLFILSFLSCFCFCWPIYFLFLVVPSFFATTCL